MPATQLGKKGDVPVVRLQPPMFAPSSWEEAYRALDADGCALLPHVLDETWLAFLRHELGGASVIQADERSGSSRTEPLLGLGGVALSLFRDAIYPFLVDTANRWSERIRSGDLYPETYLDALAPRPIPVGGSALGLFHQTAAGDDLPLRQYPAGEGGFPLQLVGLINESHVDFEGGELVLVEQRPRMQSRPTVLGMRAGDVAIIATGRRPVRGSHGDYSVNMRHALSRVRHGVRLGFELFFHPHRLPSAP